MFSNNQTVYRKHVYGTPEQYKIVNSKAKMEYLVETSDGRRLWMREDELVPDVSQINDHKTVRVVQDSD